MDIRNENNASGGRYVATVEGHEAEMTFSRTSPKLIIVDHTGVPDALRGKGGWPGAVASRRRGSTARRLEDHPALPLLQGAGTTPR